MLDCICQNIKMTVDNIPYTYLISWSMTGMKYYGVRFAKKCHPSDLFVTYFTSSAYVAEYIKEHGLPDIIEVRKTFTCENRVQKAILHEHLVLKKINAVKRQDYLNKHDGKAMSVYSSDPAIIKRYKENKAAADLKIAQDKMAADTTLYQFYHKKTGKTEFCSKTQLSYMYKINITLLNRMIDGIKNRRAVYGWCIATRDNINGNTDMTKHNFIHNDGTIENCTRKELERKYNINSGNLSEMMNGNRKSCKGWRVINTE